MSNQVAHFELRVLRQGAGRPPRYDVTASRSRSYGRPSERRTFEARTPYPLVTA